MCNAPETTAGHVCGGTPTYSTWPKGLTEADVRRIVREELTALKAEENKEWDSHREFRRVTT